MVGTSNEFQKGTGSACSCTLYHYNCIRHESDLPPFLFFPVESPYTHGSFLKGREN
ncbi:hypothetical protein NC653_002503 [Populus alba x Populus x berolinensis]|uniref:Uncharacterized protein n=1 Tax=Populus alba x Populus x berolinensis TaxID=444605 RepID=A0AAD6RPA8_9ROSI|nr:hypothetical protein NC653_002503 [Populus alba x Populus x berolinensis]